MITALYLKAPAAPSASGDTTATAQGRRLVAKPALCSCDGTRHDRDPRCPPPPGQPAVAQNLQMLTPDGRWVAATDLKPGITYVIRIRHTTRSPQ